MGAPDFISDEDFAKMAGSKSPDFISDEEFAKMAQPKPEGPYGKDHNILNKISEYAPYTAAGLDALNNISEGIHQNTPVVSQLAQKGASATIAALKTPFNDKTFGQNYQAAEDIQNAERNKFNQEHSTTGAIGGMLGSVVLPLPGGTGLGASAARIGTSTVTGAAAGALSAQKPADIVAGAEHGALWGLGGGVLGEGLGAGLNALAGKPKIPMNATPEEAGQIAEQTMKETAAEKAVESLGPTKTQIKNLMNKGEVEEVGQTLLDQGVTKGLATKGEMNDALTAKLQSTGEEIGGQLKALDDFGEKYLGQADGVVNPKDLAKQIQTTIIDPASKSVAFRSSSALTEANRIVEELNNETTNWTLSQANQQKTKIGELVSDWGAADTAGKKLVKDIYKIVNGEIENKAGAITTMRDQLIDSMSPESAMAFGEHADVPPTLEQFQTNKELYGNLKSAKDITTGSAAAEMKNNDQSLTSHIAAGGAGVAGAVIGAAHHGAGGAAIGGLALGAVAGVARNFARKYGDQLSAVAMNKFSGMGQYIPALERASQEGSQSLAVTHYLMSQKDPNYNQTYENAVKKLPQN